MAASAALLAAIAHLLAAVRLRHRGDARPWPRDTSFTAGAVLLAWAAVGGVPGRPFTAHMVRHLMVGMAAPLLLVIGRPLTLARRALAPGRARRGLLPLTHSRPVGLLVFPPLAGLLDAGGLWLLYRTQLFPESAHGRKVSVPARPTTSRLVGPLVVRRRRRRPDTRR